MGIITNKIKSNHMKTAILALIGAASAQDFKIPFCAADADCGDAIADGGCCQTMEATAVPEEAEWGFINAEDGPFKGQDMAVGTKTNICMNAAMVKCRADAEAAAGGPIDNVVDLQCFLDSNPGLNELLELDDNTAEALIDAWSSTMETNEGFLLKTYCMAGAFKMAASGAALAATAYFAL